ncbi:MAG: S8 family serine peptidase [Anaerolineales bacterium]|nr:S8 family serine peptidase [Anaerolineales bacterium]
MKRHVIYYLASIIFLILVAVGPQPASAGSSEQAETPTNPTQPSGQTEKTGSEAVPKEPSGEIQTSGERPLPSSPLPERSQTGLQIRLEQAVFDPLVALPDLAPNLTAVPSPNSEAESNYYLIQFIGPIEEEWQQKVEALGGRIMDYVPDFAYIVKMPGALVTPMTDLEFVRWVGIYQPAFRLSNSLAAMAAAPQAVATTELLVRTFTGEPEQAFTSRLAGLNGAVLEQGIDSGGGIVYKLRLPETAVTALAHISAVAWIEPYVQPQLTNAVARSSTAMNKDQVETVLGLYGENQIVVVGDTGVSTGNAATVHLDFQGRVLGGTTGAGSTCGGWQDSHSHGTHVAGSVLGSGARSGADIANHQYAGSNAGIAPEALLYAWGFCNDFSGLPDVDPYNDYFTPMYNVDGRARVNTNSWGYTAVSSGSYNTFSRETDRFIWDHPDMVVTFSAGNDGTDANSNGVVDADSMGVPAGSKNIITVGASENVRSGNAFTWGSGWPTDYPADPISSDLVADNASGMAAFSSRGPVDDGRLKPDVVAPGSNIVSTRYEGANTGWGVYDAYYLYMGGTSMSTPLVAGASAIVREFYGDTYNINPGAALVKATLINGAYDMTPGQYGTGATRDVTRRPDNNQGWGRVDLANSLVYEGHRALWFNEHAGLTTGGSYQTTFNVIDASVPFRATLVWLDYPGLEATYGALINDLDLEIIAPDNTHFYGNDILDGALDNDIDHINNVEGVDLPAQTGVYTVIVHGYNVPSGPQPFALVVTAGTAEVGYLSGVVDNGSLPLAGATVSAIGSSANSATTDGSGSYTLALPVGSYNVTASAYAHSLVTVNNVTISANATTVQNFTLAALSTYQVSGIVTDAATGWPLYARLDIPGYPGSPIWTDPVTGQYSVNLLGGTAYNFTVSAWVDGYQTAVRTIGPLSGSTTENFALGVDVFACTAPGYTGSSTAVFNHSFEGNGSNFPSDNWEQIDISGTAGNWSRPASGTLPTATPHTGSRLAMFNSYQATAGSQSRLFRTAGLNLSSYANPEASFWLFNGGCGYDANDTVQLQISTDGGTNWNNVGSPIPRQDTGGWQQYSFDLSAYGGTGMTNVRLGLLATSGFGCNISIDDVAVVNNTCTAPTTGGLTVGNVYDVTTNNGINGTAVSNQDGFSTTSTATPLDPDLSDGFYTLYSPAGSKTFTAVATGYAPATATVNVAANSTVRHDFYLGGGRLSYAPEALEAVVPVGGSTTLPLTLKNSGVVNANFRFYEISGTSTDLVQDGGFESGTPNAHWNEASSNFGTPLCDTATCGTGGGTGPRSGSFWAWFGGITATEIGSLEQAVTIPNGRASTLRFWLEIPANSGTAFLNMSLDGDLLFSVTQADAANYPSYTEVVIDVSSYADGTVHTLRFDSTTTGGTTNFFVDDVSLFAEDDIPWLSESPTSGSIAPAANQVVDAVFDATALAPGQYTGQLLISHDTPSVLPNVPVTLTVVTDYTWNGSLDSDWDEPQNWTPAVVPGGFARVTIDPAHLTGALAWPVLNVDPTVFELTVAAGAELTIPNGRSLTVNGALTNDGLLRQTIDIASPAPTRFLHITGSGGSAYEGVDITPAGAMGLTTVEIRGNHTAGCNQSNQLAHRCFDIAPATPQTATIRFWYLDHERNGRNSEAMNVYHWNGANWEQLDSGGELRGHSGRYHFVEVDGVSAYSPFGLSDGSPDAPTAVSLQSLQAAGTNTAVLPLILLSILLLLTGGWVLRRR